MRALQAQINPHFLFNTLNTIASFTRTDPLRARELLREFSSFYRATLDNSGSLIPVSREVAQTRRYLPLRRPALARTACLRRSMCPRTWKIRWCRRS
ncbi:MAG: histidine kinase [Collinsella sp.]